MTNPPLFDYRNACGCWWVVMNYLYGECEGGLSRALILNVINPTHPTKNGLQMKIIFQNPKSLVGWVGRNDIVF
jgi:hypothetical protein